MASFQLKETAIGLRWESLGDQAREHPADEPPVLQPDEEAALLSFAPPGATIFGAAASAGAPSASGPRDAARLAADTANGQPAASAMQRAPAGSSAPERPAGERTKGAPPDPDLDRLGSSLRWLQQESSRLPRAPLLAPVEGLRPIAADEARAMEEQFINGIRIPPDRLRPPPPLRERRGRLRAPMRVAVASVIAAPIAFYALVGKLSLFPQPAHQPELATRMVTSLEFPTPKEEPRPGEADDYNSMMAARNRVLPEDDMLPKAAAPPAVVETPTAAVETPPAVEPVRELDAETIKALMHQGQQLVAAGDLASARLVFRRAAEAGDAAAALAMGAAFDPTVLAQIGVHGTSADVDKARSWYEKAKRFGSPDALRRLEILANR